MVSCYFQCYLAILLTSTKTVKLYPLSYTYLWMSTKLPMKIKASRTVLFTYYLAFYNFVILIFYDLCIYFKEYKLIILHLLFKERRMAGSKADNVEVTIWWQNHEKLQESLLGLYNVVSHHTTWWFKDTIVIMFSFNLKH